MRSAIQGFWVVMGLLNRDWAGSCMICFLILKIGFFRVSNIFFRESTAKTPTNEALDSRMTCWTTNLRLYGHVQTLEPHVTMLFWWSVSHPGEVNNNRCNILQNLFLGEWGGRHSKRRKVWSECQRVQAVQHGQTDFSQVDSWVHELWRSTTEPIFPGEPVPRCWGVAGLGGSYEAPGGRRDAVERVQRSSLVSLFGLIEPINKTMSTAI